MTTSIFEELDKLQDAAHTPFGENKPTEEELVEFIKQSPKMDGGLTGVLIMQLAMQAASLIIAAWGLYINIKKASCQEGVLMADTLK